LEEGKRGFTSAAAVSCYYLLRGRVDFFAAGGGEDGKTAVAAEQRTERRQRKKRKGISQGLVCNFKKIAGTSW
jgi:hypothetical protein